MKKLVILLLGLLIGCSSNDDNSNENPIKEVNLNFKWEKETKPFLPQGLVYDANNEPYFYVSAKAAGLLVFEEKGDEEPSQVANIPIGDLYGLHAMNITQKGNYVYLSLGDFHQKGTKAGLAIIDVSNPTSPIVTAKWQSTADISGSAIVIVEGNYAYLGGMNHGLFIFDVSDKSSITELKQYLPDVNYPVEDPDDIAHPNARGMAVKGNLLYLCYDAGGIRVIDVSDKENPNEIGRYINNTSQEITPKAYNNIILNGNLAYVAVDYCGFEILDISDTKNIHRIGWWNPWTCESPINFWWNSEGHTNQLSYDAENKLVFLASGRSELSILDVSDPVNPTLKKSYGTPDNKKATWGMNMHDKDIYLLYISASVPLYSDWSGIKKVAWSLE